MPSYFSSATWTRPPLAVEDPARQLMARLLDVELRSDLPSVAIVGVDVSQQV
jgi:hypothetical protein